MKNTFIYLILILFCRNILCQSILVKYKVKEDLTERTEFLIANSKNFFYTTDFVDIKNENTFDTDENGNNIIKQQRTKLNKMHYYSVLNSPLIHFISVSPDNNKIVSIDSLPALDWKIIKTESKKINNFHCIKAETIFRGSNIVAFFTEEIAISAGPFKFKGLPGLILEVYNTDTFGLRYHWIADEIRFPYSFEKSLKFDPLSFTEPIVSYRSLIDSFSKKMDLVNQKFMTNLPRGSSVIINKSKRAGIEKVYEWEEEN